MARGWWGTYRDSQRCKTGIGNGSDEKEMRDAICVRGAMRLILVRRDHGVSRGGMGCDEARGSQGLGARALPSSFSVLGDALGPRLEGDKRQGTGYG